MHRCANVVIRTLSGFGCRILAYDKYPNEEAKKYSCCTDRMADQPGSVRRARFSATTVAGPDPRARAGNAQP